MAPAPVPFDPSKALADRRLRETLVAAVRRRVPSHEVEEIVQATLTEALASSSRPDQEEALRRWVFGIARNKVVDFHRRRAREALPEEASFAEEAPAASAPHDAIDLLRWAEREMPETDTSARTLEWMLREGSGEKLEDIARDEAVPAPAVRQRVTRMRKHFRARWAALAAAVVGGIVAFFWLRSREPVVVDNPPKIVEDPIARGAKLRRATLEGPCAQQLWDACVRGLDDAKQLDPVGDSSDEVKSVRDAAEKAKAPPAPSPTVAPPAPSPSFTAPTPSFTAPTKAPTKPTAPKSTNTTWGGGGKGKKSAPSKIESDFDSK